MTGLKTSYFVGILALIIVANYTVQLVADEIEAEEKQAVLQEFINMAEDLERQNKINEPFDNTAGIGYNTEYIPEDATQVDMTAQFEGVNQKIKWQAFTDKTLDGYIDFSPRGNWRVSYAWTTIISPDERHVQFRFDSDDQGKMWLNSEEIYANMQEKIISLDRTIVPVTLKAGKNTILVKVCNEKDESGFYLRITDANGEPIKDVILNDAHDN